MTFAREQLLKGASEVEIKDGVDDGVEEAVDVAEPDEEGEEHVVDVAHGPSEHLVSYTDGVDDVDGEERYPAEEEHTCSRTTQ